jgi:hypothetical protein
MPPAALAGGGLWVLLVTRSGGSGSVSRACNVAANSHGGSGHNDCHDREEARVGGDRGHDVDLSKAEGGGAGQESGPSEQVAEFGEGVQLEQVLTLWRGCNVRVFQNPCAGMKEEDGMQAGG